MSCEHRNGIGESLLCNPQGAAFCSRCLKPVVFVFGSNISGIHGAGAARHAKKYYGAKQGVGHGPCGMSYALPTKDKYIHTLPLSEIQDYVSLFLKYAKGNPQKTFYVTRVGCGLAGYSDQDIAPFFNKASRNCLIPKEWSPYLTQELDSEQVPKIVDTLYGTDVP